MIEGCDSDKDTAGNELDGDPEWVWRSVPEVYLGIFNTRELSHIRGTSQPQSIALTAGTPAFFAAASGA